MMSRRILAILPVALTPMKSARKKSLITVLLIAGIPLLASGGCAHTSKQPEMSPTQREQTIAAQMVALGSSHAESLLNHSQTESLRNMLGGARGVFLSPDVSGGAALVGYETGTGFLMRRHGKEWSDPVFFTLSSTNVGIQVGAKTERLLILFMTDLAVDNFVNGNMEAGGTGGFAIGTWGFGGAGAGGITGGLEEIILTTNEGAFVGGGWAGIQPKPAKKINDDTYGPNTDIKSILNVPGGKYTPARQVRARLSEMVVEAWNLSGRPDEQGKR
jgi:lipid-binding SYLF domain-containing protein